MQNAITTLRIRNFKSIKDVTISPRRVNLIIGEPNVGKSNVLEAMSLLGGMVYEQQPKFMAGMVRYEQAHQLFYDSIISQTIIVQSNQGACLIGSKGINNSYRSFYFNAAAFEIYNNQNNRANQFPHSMFYDFIIDEFENKLQDDLSLPIGPYKYAYGINDFSENGDIIHNKPSGFNKESPDVIASIHTRPYSFSKYVHLPDISTFKYLRPPNGTNLKGILQAHSSLRQKTSSLFKQDGYRLAMRSVSNELEAVKERDGIIYSVPYSSIADTLQRLIFYLAAIESNDDAVILFEEPEAHSYPVYVAQLGRRIAESRNNQFFVATHSPYLITEILETMLPDEEQAKEVAIFVAYYEDYQTKLRQLSDEEVRSIRADGLDVFYNMDRFVHPTA